MAHRFGRRNRLGGFLAFDEIEALGIAPDQGPGWMPLMVSSGRIVW
ncbi:hypothetical protein [Sphingomonas sanguinis]